MACTSQARRSLLWSIIRNPTLSRSTPSRVLPVQTRLLHATPPQRDGGFSITFGSEIYRLIGTKKGPKSAKPSADDKAKQRLSNKPVKPSSANPNIAASNMSENYLERTSKESDGYDTVLKSTNVDTKVSTHDLKGQAHPGDADTLELSENAYDEISTPRATSEHVSRPRKPSKPHSPSQDADATRSSRKLSQQTSSKTQVSDTSKGGKNGARKEASQPRQPLEQWQIQKRALQSKFGEDGWNPRKKLSPDAIEGIRTLHEQDSERFTTSALANQFEVSPEAIRRILKSKWKPSPEVMEERRARWARRHDRIWDHKEALGQRPPRRKDREPEGPEAFEEEVRAKQMLGQL